MAEVLDGQACLNCGRILDGSYCAGCGQKRSPTDLTLRELLRETTHELTNWDGKVPATLKALLFKPGLLTLDFLAGRRARWLPPLRLYLICSIAFFVSDPVIEAITNGDARQMAKVTITNDDGSMGLTPETREELERNPVAAMFGAERVERAVLRNADLNREIDAVFPKAMFLLLPVFAGLTRVMWGRKLPRYPAHLYLALHLHAGWFAVLTLTTVLGGFIPFVPAAIALSLLTMAYNIGYGLVTVRRVFADAWPITIAKSCAVAAVYTACLAIVALALLAYAIYRI